MCRQMNFDKPKTGYENKVCFLFQVRQYHNGPTYTNALLRFLICKRYSFIKTSAPGK